MDYSKYRDEFIRLASQQKKPGSFIDDKLTYVDNLVRKGVPIIFDIEHFCLISGFSRKYILSCINGQKHFYRCFSIPKASGGKRTISEPLPTLKSIQKWILYNLLYTQKPSKFSKAYRPGVSIIHNAKFHVSQPVLLKMDIKSYYDSISDYMVYNYFKSLGYNDGVSMLLTQLCTFRHCLPQGAPTSSYLSNLITKDIDEDINNICSKSFSPRLMYTRYADDISISGSFVPKQVICEVRKILRIHGLEINKEKTKVLRSCKCQTVTGIVVNKKLQKSREYRKKIRLEVYYCKKNGVMKQFEIAKTKSDYVTPLSFAQSLLGRINHCLFINPDDVEMQENRNFVLNQVIQLMQ